MRSTITAFCLTVFFAAFPVHVIGQEKVGGAVTVTTPAATFDPVALYGKAAKEKWEETIQKMEAQDRQEKDPENGVLLIGSSSIRLWETASEDLAPFPVIPRGYGGARYSDLAVFIDRIIKPHRFRACVMFVGNDVTGSKDDRTPEEVRDLVQYILAAIHRHEPQAKVFIVEITPTPKRFAAWPQIRQVNAVLRELALTDPNTHFIPTADYYLTADDQPVPKFFREDKLHQTREGYRVWGKIIQRALTDLIESPTP